MLIILVSNKEICHGRRTIRGTLRHRRAGSQTPPPSQIRAVYRCRHSFGLLLGGVARSPHSLGLPAWSLACNDAMDDAAQRGNDEPTAQNSFLLHAAGP